MDNYIKTLREQILNELDDLRQKISDNEPFPEKEQDLSTLVDISENIEFCLNHWYY